MTRTPYPEALVRRLRHLSPRTDFRPRLLAGYSAAVALAEDTAQQAIIETGRSRIDRTAFYEVVLQSYLLLGFPRMLAAAEVLDRVWPPDQRTDGAPAPISPAEAQRWYDDGMALCRRVYAGNFDRLRQRVTAMAPEIFRWMIIEGYGKVYSRPGLTPVERELANVSALVVEARPQQLYSHIRGAVHVGAETSLVRTVIEDLGPEVGPGYRMACEMLHRLQASA